MSGEGIGALLSASGLAAGPEIHVKGCEGFEPLLSHFPEMTLRFPPFFNVLGKGYMRSGRGGRKFESCRLDGVGPQKR